MVGQGRSIIGWAKLDTLDIDCLFQLQASLTTEALLLLLLGKQFTGSPCHQRQTTTRLSSQNIFRRTFFTERFLQNIFHRTIFKKIKLFLSSDNVLRESQTFCSVRCNAAALLSRGRSQLWTTLFVKFRNKKINSLNNLNLSLTVENKDIIDIY